MKFSFLSFWAILLSVLGVALMLCFTFNKSFNDGSGVINPSLASNFGSLVGGIVGPIFSLAGIILLIETLRQQNKAFQIQQFEASFFELVRYHRENVNTMQMRVPSKQNESYNGYRCFIEFKYQFEEIFERICKLYPIKDEDNKCGKEKRIRIAYIILFFGVGKNASETIRDFLSEYDSNIINSIIENLREKKAAYDDNTVYYGGNQSRLAHYFRHLFYVVSFVDGKRFLSENEKYTYVKIIRSQLTQYELAIFFYNSFSPMGVEWQRKNLIQKYRLIKNMPKNFLKEIDPVLYYPKMKYEWQKYQPLKQEGTRQRMYTNQER